MGFSGAETSGRASTRSGSSASEESSSSLPETYMETSSASEAFEETYAIFGRREAGWIFFGRVS